MFKSRIQTKHFPISDLPIAQHVFNPYTLKPSYGDSHSIMFNIIINTGQNVSKELCKFYKLR